LVSVTYTVEESKDSEDDDDSGSSGVNLDYSTLTVGTISLNVDHSKALQDDFVPLDVWIYRVSQIGEVYIEFSKPMQYFEDLTVFEEFNVLNLGMTSEELSDEYLEKAIVKWYVADYTEQYLIL
jgi:hypothetical protein